MVAGLLTRLAAGAYALRAALGQALRDPRWIARAWQRARALWRAGGTEALARHVWDDFLPRHFRVRTRVRLGGPSPSVFRKFAGLVRTPAPGPGLALPQGELREPVRVLVIRSAAMGDVLMATPIVRRLAQQRGALARIDVATQHPEVFAGNPYVHRVVDPGQLAREPHAYDLVIDLDGSYERNPACHAVDAYALHAFGECNFDRSLELFPDAAAQARIEVVRQEIGAPYLVLHKPQHHWPNRNLPADFWERFVHQLLAGSPYPLVQIGGAGDLAVQGDPRLLDHRRRYRLHELQQLIVHSAGFVGVDAGPLHVAASTAAPVCAFFTSAHHAFRRPLRQGGVFVPLVPDIDCYGCQASNPPPGLGYFCRRGDNACVTRFDAERAARQVLDAIRASAG